MKILEYIHFIAENDFILFLKNKQTNNRPKPVN